MARRTEIKAKLRAFRADHGLTQAQLAELLLLESPLTAGQVTVSRWESDAGATPPPYLGLALERLAAILHASAAREARKGRRARSA